METEATLALALREVVVSPHRARAPPAPVSTPTAMSPTPWLQRRDDFEPAPRVMTPDEDPREVTIPAMLVRDSLERTRVTFPMRGTDQYGRRAIYSSYGPTEDGRIKPELLAPGDYIMSAA